MTIAGNAREYVYDKGWNDALEHAAKMIRFQAERHKADTHDVLLQLADDILNMKAPSRVAGVQRGAS